ncbi:hypothetical protein SAMN05877753_102639 [Bacillus oleivorans]|uniref:DUF3221 domain-containing protein n=1 Tax=Bacillus oleivorans TaxID=1448271 RepID=A0A285CM70_9BACI|nr:hypothetical protein [Bacillus oleivorans]SNX68649.1 hypothetical protein SAMN05877753_102639 [Bacillus oleivorans]
MIKRFILFIFISFSVTGCIGLNTFDAKLDIRGESTFIVDCSNEVNRGKNSTDEGYSCTVKITEKTTFRNENGDEIRIDDFTEGDYVRVIHSDLLGISRENREVKAKEIILLNP